MKTKTTKPTKTAKIPAAVQNTIATIRCLHTIKPLYQKLPKGIDQITNEIKSGATQRRISEMLAVNAEIYRELSETCAEIAKMSATASRQMAPKKTKPAKKR